VTDSGADAERLLRAEAEGCQRCPQLASGRTQVVFASGPVDAEVMFIGEAPGASEDREGVPFVGASGRLLDQLLEGIELSRDDVYIANVLKCRPPENRDPRSDEIANCFSYLERQVEIVAPTVVVTLGNSSTKLLRADDTGISKIRGQAEICEIGSRTVWLLPVFHPAAALYRRPNLELLSADFKLLPELVGRGAPAQVDAAEPPPLPDPKPASTPVGGSDAEVRPQLDLF
jgi:uracil-DNA glycosylase